MNRGRLGAGLSRALWPSRLRLRTTAAALLLLVGVLMLTEAVVTLAWQEPLSAISAQRAQDRLSDELRRQETAALAAPMGFAADGGSDTHAAIARRYREFAAAGDALGRIEIPALGAKYVFVSGVKEGDLDKGPGHYPTTALPGEPGTVGIAGHRTTHAAPFRKLDQLDRGDMVLIRMPYGRFRYRVDGRSVVAPDNTKLLRAGRHARLALTTCHPPFSATQRMVVTASLRSAKFRTPQRP
jgi:sortase A